MLEPHKSEQAAMQNKGNWAQFLFTKAD